MSRNTKKRKPARKTVSSIKKIAQSAKKILQADTELAQLVSLDSLLYELSTNFINAPVERFDEEITFALEQIAQCLQIERISLAQFPSQDENSLETTHYYAPPDINPPPVILKDFSWTIKKIKQKEIIVVNDPKNIPDSAVPELKLFKKNGLKGIVVIPLAVAGSALGMISINDITKAREWPKELLSRFRCIGELFANILIRKRSAVLLAQKKVTYRTLVNTSPDAIVMSDLEGVLTFLSPQALDLYGYDRDNELIGHSFKELISPEDWGMEQERFRNLVADGKMKQITDKHIRKDKSIFYGETSAALIFDDKAKAMGILRVIRDVSERKQAEEELRESEEGFRAFMEQSPVAIQIMNPEGQILQVNDAYAELWGVSREELSRIHEEYNILRDDQVESLGFMPYIERAFAGEPISLPPFEYDPQKTSSANIKGRKRIIRSYMYSTKDKNRVIRNVIMMHEDITERRKIEDDLKERERLLNKVGDIARIGGWEMDLEKGGKAVWTKGVYDIVEIEQDEPIPGANEHVDWYLPEYREMIKKKMKDLIETKQPMVFEAMLETKKGNLKWCQAIGEVVETDGRVVKVRGIFQDITERKMAEEKIKDLARFPEENPNPVLRIDKHGTVLYSNIAGKILLAIWGSAVGKKLPGFWTDLIAKVFSSGEDCAEELVCGDKVYLFDITPVLEEYVNLYARDITQRKQSENDLKVFRALLDQSNDAIFIVDPKTAEVIDLNDRACDLYGYSRKEMLAMRVMDIETIFPDELSWEKHVEEVRARGMFVIEGRSKTKYGAIFPIEANVKYVEFENKQYIVSSVRNITERKKNEMELREAYNQLKEAQEQIIQSGKMAAMGQMAAGISHELNQPLTGIKGFAQAMQMDLEENSPFREDINRILEQADRMDKIIKEIRFFSRKSKFKMEKISIHKPLEDSLSLISQQLKLRNIRLNLDFSENLPDIQGDENQLQQIFVNLISNARDAIDSLECPEGGDISVATALTADKKHVEIKISDTGCGISQESLNNIFNPFFTTKSPDGGIGLGLSIVYRIIKNHNGDISVESEEGQGTKFTITFPVS
ncbi:MAG: PAS domain S-box protein [Candidatus Omnitrophota bacterium]